MKYGHYVAVYGTRTKIFITFIDANVKNKLAFINI